MSKVAVEQRIKTVESMLDFFLYRKRDIVIFQGKDYVKVEYSINYNYIHLLIDLYAIAILHQYGEEIPIFRLKRLKESSHFLFKQKIPASTKYYITFRNGNYGYDFELFNQMLNGKIISVYLPKWIKADFIFGSIYLAMDKNEEFTDLLVKQTYRFDSKFIDDWDNSVRDYIRKFDCFFDYNETLKVVSLDLFFLSYPYKEIDSNEFILIANKFRSNLKYIENLIGHFDRLELSPIGSYSIFGIFFFPNKKYESLDYLSKLVFEIWKGTIGKIFLKYGIKYEPRYRLYRTVDTEMVFTSGIIRKGGQRYDKFICTTLYYMANIHKFFDIHVSGQKLFEDTYSSALENYNIYKDRASLKSIKKQNKPSLPRKPRRSISKKLLTTIESEFLKDIRVNTPLKKSLLDIELMYFILKKEISLENVNFKVLMFVEAFVFVAETWKQQLFEPRPFYNTPWKCTDLGILLNRLPPLEELKNLLEMNFSNYGYIFSVRITITYLAIIKTFQQVPYISSFLENETKEIFIVSLRFYLTLKVGELKEHVSFICPNHITSNNLFEKLQNSAKKNPETSLQVFLKNQLNYARKFEAQIHNYLKNKNIQGTQSIFISLEVSLNKILNYFEKLDASVRTTIDSLMKESSKQVSVYLGGWDLVVQNGDNTRVAKLTIMFLIDKHTVGVKHEFVNHFADKLYHYLLKIEFIDKSQDVTLTLKESFFTPTHNINEDELIKIWLMYQSHKHMYLVTVPENMKKKVIKGLSAYKKRNLKNKIN